MSRGLKFLGPIEKSLLASSLVESPDNFLEIIKGMRESSLVESPGKLVRKFLWIKAYRKSVI
jgi:hypothetical protein